MHATKAAIIIIDLLLLISIVCGCHIVRNNALFKKVADFGTNRKPIFDFLLLNNTVLTYILSRTTSELSQRIGSSYRFRQGCLLFNSLVRGKPWTLDCDSWPQKDSKHHFFISVIVLWSWTACWHLSCRFPLLSYITALLFSVFSSDQDSGLGLGMQSLRLLSRLGPFMPSSLGSWSRQFKTMCETTIFPKRGHFPRQTSFQGCFGGTLAALQYWFLLVLAIREASAFFVKEYFPVCIFWFLIESLSTVHHYVSS